MHQGSRVRWYLATRSNINPSTSVEKVVKRAHIQKGLQLVAVTGAIIGTGQVYP